MPVTMPDTVEGFQQFMADADRVTSAIGDGDFGDVVAAYVEAVRAREQGELAEQVHTQIQSTLAQWMRDNEVELRRQVNIADLARGGNMPHTRNAIYNPKAPGAALDHLDRGDYFRATWAGQQDPSMLRVREEIRNVSEGTPSEGGYLVPESLRATLLELSLEQSIVRPRAQVIPMETLRVPIPFVDETTHVGSVYGGVIAYWTEEAGALVASEAKFGRVVLEAKKETAYSEIPSELLQDSITSFMAIVERQFPAALAHFEDIAYFSGTGAGEPFGWQNGAANINVARGTASEVNFVDVANMYSRMLPTSLNSAVWLCSPAVIPELLQMQLTSGAGAIFLGGQGNAAAAGAPPMSILGRPLIVTEKNPDLGSLGDLAFVDFNYYLVGDRQQMQAANSMHYKFGNDVTAYRVIQRVDGRPWIQSALTPVNGGNTLSPFVRLAA